MMDFMELIRETTRLRREAQYLQDPMLTGCSKTQGAPQPISTFWVAGGKGLLRGRDGQGEGKQTLFWGAPCPFHPTHLVILNIRSSLRARMTLIPKEVPGRKIAQITSKMLPTVTCRHVGQGEVQLAGDIQLSVPLQACSNPFL